MSETLMPGVIVNDVAPQARGACEPRFLPAGAGMKRAACAACGEGSGGVRGAEGYQLNSSRTMN